MFSVDTADVQWQSAQIARMDGGINITPWALCRQDLRVEILRLQAQGVVCMVAGDSNTTWDTQMCLHTPPAAQREHIQSWHRWAKKMPLGNAMQLRDHGPTPTFHRSNTANDMDVIFDTICVERRLPPP